MRDLNVLIQNDFLNKIGGGRSVKYKEMQTHPMHKYVDIDEYFETSQEEENLYQNLLSLKFLKNWKMFF